MTFSVGEKEVIHPGPFTNFINQLHLTEAWTVTPFAILLGGTDALLAIETP